MSFEYKTDTEEAQRRMEAWWNREVIDRPVVAVAAPRKPGAAAPDLDTSGWTQERYRRYFTDPREVIPRLKANLRSTYFLGESFPVMFPVSGGMVAILAYYLGSPVRYVSAHTTWHVPIIHDWSTTPALDYNPDNEVWKATRRLLEAAVQESDGYFVGIPDLNGPTEVLSLLRDHEKLALDFYDNPEVIKPSVTRINQAWLRYWQECMAITARAGGYFTWMRLWSSRPATDLQSDFSCMISREHFNEYFLPFIEEQTRKVERTIYHLDGPGAIRHIDALLDIPRLTGIQWVQGAGGGSMLDYLPLLKRIQDAKKLVFVSCLKGEVGRLWQELNPRGLHVVVEDCQSLDEGDEVLRLARACGRRQPGLTTIARRVSPNRERNGRRGA